MRTASLLNSIQFNNSNSNGFWFLAWLFSSKDQLWSLNRPAGNSLSFGSETGMGFQNWLLHLILMCHAIHHALNNDHRLGWVNLETSNVNHLIPRTCSSVIGTRRRHTFSFFEGSLELLEGNEWQSFVTEVHLLIGKYWSCLWSSARLLCYIAPIYHIGWHGSLGSMVFLCKSACGHLPCTYCWHIMLHHRSFDIDMVMVFKLCLHLEHCFQYQFLSRSGQVRTNRHGHDQRNVFFLGRSGYADDESKQEWRKKMDNSWSKQLRMDRFMSDVLEAQAVGKQFITCIDYRISEWVSSLVFVYFPSSCFVSLHI